MKKIVSLLLATAVIFCLGITSFASNVAPFTFEGDKEVAVGSSTTDVTIKMGIDLDKAASIGIIAFTFDFGGEEGIKVKEIADSAITSYLPLYTGGTDIATGLFTYMKDDASGVDIPAGVIEVPVTFTVDDTAAKEYAVTLTTDSMLVTADGDALNDCATYPTAKIVVKEGSSEPSNIITKTGSLADTGFINNLRVIDEKGTETKGFIGAAVGFKFVTPADITLDDNMIWALTTADGKAYSPKFNAGLSALGKNADVTVAATLTTGVDGVNTEITAVNGIFKDAASDTYYYTDATDAPTE